MSDIHGRRWVSEDGTPMELVNECPDCGSALEIDFAAECRCPGRRWHVACHRQVTPIMKDQDGRRAVKRPRVVVFG